MPSLPVNPWSKAFASGGTVRPEGVLARYQAQLPQRQAETSRKASVMSQAPSTERWQPEYEVEPGLEAPMISPDDLIGSGIPTKLAMLAKSISPLAVMGGVIKNKGGNWLEGSVEGALKGLKKTGWNNPEALRPYADQLSETQRAAVENALKYPGKEEAINQWIDKPLAKYIKNEMATPEDPIRTLAEKGITHDPSIREIWGTNAPAFVKEVRMESGFPKEGMHTSPLAGTWENVSDSMLRKSYHPNPYKPGEEMAVLSPKDNSISNNLGFNHLIDELSNAINPESGLPRHLQFPADRLSKVSVPQAVERVSAINAWRAAMKAEADQARANNAATVLHKEYPEGKYFRAGEGNFFTPDKVAAELFSQNFGGKVTQHHLEPRRSATDTDVENVAKMLGIHQEGTPAGQYLEQGDNAVFEEAPQMLEELRNQGFDSALINDGMSKHPSLVALDPSIIKKSVPNPQGLKWVELKGDLSGDTPDAISDTYRPGYAALRDALKYEGDTMGHCVGGYCDDVASGRSRIYSLRDAKGQPHVTIETGVDSTPYDEDTAVKTLQQQLGRHPTFAEIDDFLEANPSQSSPRIVQIKGKQNRAPNPEYLPMVQDFVKSGKWSDVGDLQNTGLRRSQDAFNELEKQKLTEAGHTINEYLSPEEIDDLQAKFGQRFAQGGRVRPNKIETVADLSAIIRAIQSGN